VHISGLYTSMAGPYISQHQGGDSAALSMNRAAGPDWGIEGGVNSGPTWEQDLEAGTNGVLPQ